MYIAILLAAALALLPNKHLTPGATNPVVMQSNIQQTICKSGFTDDARQTTTAMKLQVFEEYGIDPKDSGKYEVDHLISLELGGADVLKNLWPQAYCPTKKQMVATCGGPATCPVCYGAREKDVVETNFKRRVCAGTMTLHAAQRKIATNWLAEYKKIKGI